MPFYGGDMVPVRKQQIVGWGNVCSRMTQAATELRVGSKYPESQGAGLGNGQAHAKVRPN